MTHIFLLCGRTGQRICAVYLSIRVCMPPDPGHVNTHLAYLCHSDPERVEPLGHGVRGREEEVEVHHWLGFDSVCDVYVYV